MSVMTLGFDLYQEVYKKACTYQWRNIVDINYCSTLRSNEGYLRDWIYTLFEMVEISYCVHYKKQLDEEFLLIGKSIIDSWRYDNLKGENCNTYQMLKHLQCIYYQIEDYEMKPGGVWKDEYNRAFKELKEAIQELKSRIIAAIPEYNEAKWGSV